jgi:hypothetical protein
MKRSGEALVVIFAVTMIIPALAVGNSVIEVFNRGGQPVTVFVDGKQTCKAQPGMFCDSKAARGKHQVQVVVSASEKYKDWVIVPAPTEGESVGACMFTGKKLECAHEDIGK